jgi:hypothetical protein
MRDKEHQHEGEARAFWRRWNFWKLVKEDAFSRDREQYSAKWCLSVYVPWASSMQLHPFMLGIDVARRVLLLISPPPFQAGSTGKPVPKIINKVYRA